MCYCRFQLQILLRLELESLVATDNTDDDALDEQVQEVRSVLLSASVEIPTKHLHNHYKVSVHFNNFYCTNICDKLKR